MEEQKIVEQPKAKRARKEKPVLTAEDKKEKLREQYKQQFQEYDTLLQAVTKICGSHTLESLV